MQVRPTVVSETIIIELTTENGRITLLDNTITLDITADDTEALPTGAYKYDLEIQTGAEVIRLVQGSFTVSPEVTRPVP
jgi:tRNA threonylcarbamoyladenosine modification (KEOPS) complex  Pcc1 subunit